MDIWKYLPTRLKKSREVKKVIARQKIHGEMVASLYSQKDEAIKDAAESGVRADELEVRVEELQSKLVKITGERDIYKDAGKAVYAAAEELKQGRDDIVADILLGPTSKFFTDYTIPNWLTEAIIRKAKEHRDSVFRSQKIIKKMEKDRFSRDVKLLGGVESISRIPLMVYENEEVIYETKIFDKMAGSSYRLRTIMQDDPALMKSLKKGKKAVLQHNGGELHFVPEKLKNHESVAIAYFVPGEEYFIQKNRDFSPKEQKKRSKTFEKFGEKGARAIYKTLKSHDKQGLELI